MTEHELKMLKVAELRRLAIENGYGIMYLKEFGKKELIERILKEERARAVKS